MNLPNKLTVFRLILIVPIVYLLISREQLIYLTGDLRLFKITNYVVVFLFIVASITDYYDGVIARKLNLITNFGKLFDPFADKLLVISVLLVFAAYRYVSVVLVLIVIARELFITSYRALVATKGKVIAADVLGKYKTFFQMIMIIVALLFNTSILVNNLLLMPSVLLSLISAFDYVKSNPIEME